VRDQPIGVLGTNPGSVAHALLVRQWSGDMVFFAHTTEPSADELEQLAARGVQVVRGAVARLVIEADRLTGVELTDGRVIPRAALFVRPLNRPHPDGLLAGLGCDLDEAGFAAAAPAYATPEIYREDGAQAKQWQQISKWATLNGQSRIYFAGSFTQHGACGQVGGCSGINNTASEGWNQLVAECARDSATALSSLRFAQRSSGES
jgi:hypothetical protein